MRRLVPSGCLVALLASGCGRQPPASRFPDAQAALDRMHASYACTRGVSADAKLDYIGPRGRVRGNVLYLASVPDRLRLDLSSPFGAMVSTLTSDGRRFSLMDLREKRFLYGPANACNLARFTQVSLPPAVLVDLLRGEAPVLVHAPSQASVAWESGRYVLRISSKHGASERIELEPLDADFTRPWTEQRVRVLGVEVEQAGVTLYRVGLEEHAPASTAKARVDPDGIDAPIPPSGPVCSAELPRRIHIEVPVEGHDLVIRVNEVAHNPPLAPGAFTQPQPGGVRTEYSACAE
ncbi:MAG TPA: hypothetical protein VGK73_12235 [Polyangiaceae bacterium]